MGFFRNLFEVVGKAFIHGFQTASAYPRLQDVIKRYTDDDFSIIECAPFTATLSKDGMLGKKTISLTVLEDGSVLVEESGMFGEQQVISYRPDLLPPEQWWEQRLQEQEKIKQQNERRRYENHADANKLHETRIQEACEILGVEVSEYPNKIKSAYRQKMQEYHPDKVATLPEGFRKYAHEQTIAIRAAYNFLCSINNSSIDID